MPSTLAKEATISVLLGRFNDHRLPRILALKKMAERGERLGDFDLRYLERVIGDVHHLQHLSAGSARHQALLAKIITLYTTIIAAALENERQANSR
ncbi:MAG: hypothetical protein V7707_07940 [Motiliproteus sp.]